MPYFAAAAAQLGICLYTYLKKAGEKGSVKIVVLCFLFGFVTLLVFNIYVWTVGKVNPMTIQLAMLFVSLQVIFVIPRLLSVGINMIIIVCYIAFSRYIHSFPESLYPTINIILACVISVTANRLLTKRLIDEILISHIYEKEREKFFRESIQDSLTELSNRRHFNQSVDFYLSVCRRVHQTVCVIMMDIDYFKMYNDYYGHQKGDMVLKSIGKVLKRITLEEQVFAVRVGGEEFIILWTENRISEAERVVRKLRRYILEMNIPHEKSLAAPYVTASYGLYVMRGGSQDSADEMYNNADMALYKAKQDGRDCIVVHDSQDNSYRSLDLTVPEEER
jgi:diguanylate cyclase (GGDEF)-like protein